MAGSRETTPEQFEGMDEGRSRFKEVAESSEGDDSADDGPRKRTKVDATDATAAPKWSNPDPYTVLPPPETLGAPKKDIVQTIRKAKNDQAAKVDKVADNSDFISFNFDDDDDEEDAVMDEPSPPAAKSPARTGEPTFSHRDSSDSDYVDQRSPIVAERVSRPPKRKSRDTRQMGDVTEEWQAVDGQPIAPWSTRDHSATADVGLR
jgi:non-canonical poly(A) RNA polymerase PAPD5/7